MEPNTALIAVPDARLAPLAGVYRSRKVTPTTVTVVDVAGLVKGASQGEGLGNQFLGHLRATHALAMVVRCFVDAHVPHVEAALNPLADVDTVNLELVLADLGTVSQRYARVEKLVQLGKSQDAAYLEVLRRLRSLLDGGAPARSLDLNPADERMLRDLQLISLKPLVYVANVAEADLRTDQSALRASLAARAAQEGVPLVVLSAKLEAQLAQLAPEDARAYRESLALPEPGAHTLIRAAYQLLGLVTFFTANETELRAWTLRAGQHALDAAGIVHTDFQRGFIKAEVVSYADLVAAGTLAAARNQGRVRVEGRDYVVQDGDILLFRFSP